MVSKVPLYHLDTWTPDNSTEVKGHCIVVFDRVMAALPYGVPYESFSSSNSDHRSAGSDNDSAYLLYLGGTTLFQK
ncbi:hypothetical protein Pfo_010641 [Paulownia fortunei]|nr:hypothetical protein Pfo_010641 [Paulownia fortunei]